MKYFKYDKSKKISSLFSKQRLKQYLKYFFLLGALIYSIWITTRSFFSNGLIPIGWDTANHMYYAKLILDGQMDIMFIETEGNNFLPSFIIALLAIPLSSNILLSTIIFTISLPILLLITFWWTSQKLYDNPNYAIIAFIVCAIWITPYRLSGGLFRTIVAYILIIPIFYFYSADIPKRKRYFSIILLTFLATLAQIQVTILFLGSSILLEIWRAIRSKKIDRNKIVNIIIIICAIIPPFLFAISFSSYFVTVSISYATNLPIVPINRVLLYLGGPLIPFVLIGLTFLIYRLLKGEFDQNSLVTMFNIIIICFILIPSYFITNPSVFRVMAERSTTLVLVPLLVPNAIKCLKKILKKISKFRQININKIGKIIISFYLVVLILLSNSYIQNEAAIHQQPFISNNSLDQIKLLAEKRDPQKTLILITNENPVVAYKDNGWVGTYIGNHYHFNGPSIFLISGMFYPSNIPNQISAIQRQLNYIQSQGINFPINRSDIELAIITNFYGQLTLEESEVFTEVGSGVYLIDGSNASRLIEDYSLNGVNYYKYQGNWQMRNNYNLAELRDISGSEYIDYLLPFYYQGSYTIIITHRNGIMDGGGFKVYINETYIDQLLYWGALCPRNYTFEFSFEAKTIGFLKIVPIQSNQDVIQIYKIIVVYNYNSLDQIKLLAEKRDPQKTLILITNENPVVAYKDNGWVGTYIGNHYHFNGPSIFLISGMFYPSNIPNQISAIQRQLNYIQSQGINFPINRSDIELAIITNFYGQLTLEESEVFTEVGSGVYLIDGSNASRLIEDYSLNGVNYYKYQGNWQMRNNYNLAELRDISGSEYIDYLLPFYYQGSYTIIITHRNGIMDGGGFKVYINETYIDQLLYWGALCPRNYTFEFSFEAKTIGFLKIVPIQSNQDVIQIYKIIVVYNK